MRTAGIAWNWIWLGVVLVGTGIALLFGQLPGAEPAPYILRFTEDRPNPLYRRICYTFAWNALLNFAVLNLAGLAWAVVERTMADEADLCSRIHAGAACRSPAWRHSGFFRGCGVSTQGEGWERRYFYGAVWSVTAAQTIFLILWKALPKNHATDIAKLLLIRSWRWCLMGVARRLGVLPRTRPILPGELMVAD